MTRKILSALIPFVLVLLLLPMGAPVFAAGNGKSQVKLNKSSVTLGIGESMNLIASGGSNYKWSTGNSSVATVNAGRLTAKKKGSTTVTVKSSGGKTATCKVTVKPAPTSVRLNKTSITLGVGEQYDLDSYVNSGAAAYYRPFVSDNSSVASVAKSGGLVTAKKPGTAVVSVTLFNGKTATCKVTVKPAPTSVRLNKTSITLGVGEQFDLDSYVNGGAAAYYRTYTSNNSSIVSVAKNGGLMTAKKPGTATCKVITFNGKTATCKVTVKPAPTSVRLNKTSITLGVGEQFDLDSYVNSGAAAYYRPFMSNNTSVASVAKSGGLVTAKKPGTATVSVTLFNGKTATCKVTVKPAPTSLTFNKTALTLGVGEQFDLDSFVNSGSAAYYRPFVSDNSSVASVAKSGGIVTAQKPGTAKISVTVFNGKTATCTVTVKPAPTSIKMSTSLVKLKIGQRYKLTGTVNDGAASNKLVYVSNNPAIATVSPDGLVTAQSNGTVWITVNTYNGKSDSCKIVVGTGVDNSAELHRKNSIKKLNSALTEIGWNTSGNNVAEELYNIFEQFDITGKEQICHFVSQVSAESGCGKWTKELANGNAYEGRTDLGNTQKGDGPKYKGAGYLQITGRYTYQRFADYVNDQDVVNYGCDYVAENYPWESAGYYWCIAKNINNILYDQNRTVKQVTYMVNGGYTMLEVREKYYAIAKKYITDDMFWSE